MPAVGDVHGDLQKVLSCLEMAGVLAEDDGHIKWVGGDTTVVQLGDVLDRGDCEIGAPGCCVLGGRAGAGAGGVQQGVPRASCRPSSSSRQALAGPQNPGSRRPSAHPLLTLAPPPTPPLRSPPLPGSVLLLRELDRQARQEGGAVYMLNGNHESLNVAGDFR